MPNNNTTHTITHNYQYELYCKYCRQLHITPVVRSQFHNGLYHQLQILANSRWGRSNIIYNKIMNTINNNIIKVITAGVKNRVFTAIISIKTIISRNYFVNYLVMS